MRARLAGFVSGLRSRRWILPFVVLLGPVWTSAGCAVNPVTGQRQFTLISESQEIQIGRDADREIVAQMGLVDDPELQRYIQDLGMQMASRSERPSLPWTFRVLDDPVVNAFALPGGFIYVTRGILAHFSSEAELAGVLGHEIGHVTARHGVQQVSRAQLAQMTLGVGTALFPELEAFEGLLGGGMGLLLLRYGREAERQADDLGLAYMTGLDYDPREMAATFEMLFRASGGEAADRLPGWLSSHPDPLERRDRILGRVEREGIPGTRVEQGAYLQRLEGLLFGVNPREGFVQNGAFFHPDLAFRLDFPAGWRVANQRQSVQAVHPEQDALLALTLASESTPEAALRAFLASEGVSGTPRTGLSLNNLPLARAEFRAATSSGGSWVGEVGFVAYGGRVYRLLGYAPEARWAARAAVVRGAMGSFRPLEDPTVLSVDPRRIRMVALPRSLTLSEFYAQFPSTVSLETIALLNRAEPETRFPEGTLLKQVVGTGIPSP